MPSEEPGARRGEAFHLLAWSADVRWNLVRRGEAGAVDPGVVRYALGPGAPRGGGPAGYGAPERG